MSARGLRTPGGRLVKLGRILGQGGEGEVLAVAGGKEVAKLYWPSKRTAEQRRKIELMISRPPRDPMKGRGLLSLAWPVDVLLDGNGAFIGFLMPRLDTRRCRPIHEVYRASSYPLGIDWAMLVRTARNLASVVAAVHRAGYVIGDLNESNALVATNTVVTLVDCDSMQVTDPSRQIAYRCGVGKLEYTPPELHGKDFSAVDRAPSADLFALAALICQLLIRGRHPFSGGPGATIGDNIQAGETFFVNGFASAPGSMPPPDLLPPAIHRLFERALVTGGRDPDRRPRAEEWKHALDGLLARMASCRRYSSHEHSAHLTACPWCVFEARAGRAARPPAGRSVPHASAPPPGHAARSGSTVPARAPATAWSWTSTTRANPVGRAVGRAGSHVLSWFVRKLRNAAVGCVLLGLFGVLLVLAVPLLFDAAGGAPAGPAGVAGRPAGAVPLPQPPADPEPELSPSDPFEEVRARRARPDAWASLGELLAERGRLDLAAGAVELSTLLSGDLSSAVDWKPRREVLAVLDRAQAGDDEWLGDEGDRARTESRAESAQALYHLAHLLDPNDREWLRKIEPRRGLRVVRGIDWKDAYGTQDGGRGAEGVVVAVPPETRAGWVKVEWAGRDDENWYRWGEEQEFELALSE